MVQSSQLKLEINLQELTSKFDTLMKEMSKRHTQEIPGRSMGFHYPEAQRQRPTLNSYGTKFQNSGPWKQMGNRRDASNVECWKCGEKVISKESAEQTLDKHKKVRDKIFVK